MVNVADLGNEAVLTIDPICIQMRTHLPHSLYMSMFCKDDETLSINSLTSSYMLDVQ